MLVIGDNPRAARHIAAQADIGEVHAQVLPEDKAALAGKLQAGGHKVAMGGGTDVATESADIILIRDDLTLVLAARDVSRRCYRRVRQNVALAFTFNGVGIPLAATGLVYPVWAMAAMAASVTAIFVNSLGGRPSLLFAAIGSVGRQAQTGAQPGTAAGTTPGGARA